MSEYIKKPVVIEAFIFGCEDMPEWMHGAHYVMNDSSMLIDTLEGTMLANVGDYIIKEIQGEIYPCKPEIFLETYERVYE